MAPRLLWQDPPPGSSCPLISIYIAHPAKLHAGHRPAMRNHHIYCAHRPPFIYHNHSNVNRTTARRVLQSPRPHPSWHRASMTYVFIFIERNQHINWSSKQGLSITITQASWMPIPGCHDGKLTVLWARTLISTREQHITLLDQLITAWDIVLILRA